MLIRSLLSLIISVFVLLDAYAVQSYKIMFKHNLKLGMEKKDAKKLLEAAGYGKVEEQSDSKDVDLVLIQDSLMQGFHIEENAATESELEFFEDKLMIIKLTYSPMDIFELKKLENKYSIKLIDLFGNPASKDTVMGISSWIWENSNYRIVFSSNTRKKKVTINNMYLPLLNKKFEKELKTKLKGKPVDVGRDTFLK